MKCSNKLFMFLTQQRTFIEIDLPFEIRNAVSLEEFSTNVDTWKHGKCPCKLRPTYIHLVGYI